MDDKNPTPWLRPEWRPANRTTIVFVHGAVVEGWEMAPLRQRLSQLGYRTRQFYYHSMLRGLDHNVDELRRFLADTEGETLHVVGHSMGGVLIRHVFEQTPDPRPGRLVAIGSPFIDCWIGRRVNRFHPRLGRLLIGQTVFDHISRPADIIWRGTRDFGVIAGTYRFGIAAIFPSHPNPTDGVVLLDETRLQGIHDTITFKLNHFGMLLSKRCTAEIACFLVTGKFGQDASKEPPVAAVNHHPTNSPALR
ncbi:MAG: alpha/beta hydrolase [Methylacidiphilales bacterium]|nr:alpha/beta hydrolase [Candidatus Methylacidiphilales bacterium]